LAPPAPSLTARRPRSRRPAWPRPATTTTAIFATKTTTAKECHRTRGGAARLRLPLALRAADRLQGAWVELTAPTDAVVDRAAVRHKLAVPAEALPAKSRRCCVPRCWERAPTASQRLGGCGTAKTETWSRWNGSGPACWPWNPQVGAGAARAPASGRVTDPWPDSVFGSGGPGRQDGNQKGWCGLRAAAVGEMGRRADRWWEGSSGWQAGG